MALPCSGPLSISQIHTELGSSSYSLHTLSVAAGKGTPDAISEFYCYSNRSISFSNLYSLGYTGSVSGTVTIVGTWTFQAAAALYYGGGTVSANITVNGNTRSASRGGASGTNYSSTFTLTSGTYAYSLSVTVSSGSGGSGYINAY
jgi:hypothetical protein